MDIEQTLVARFSAPLKENYKRRIIFWHDPDREFEQAIDEIAIPNVKVLKLTGSNNFYAKMLLSETDLDSDYLVYNPISYKDVKDNWLLDIECYSEEFRADMLSIRMAEYNMPNNSAMRKALKLYNKFFENKERAGKLASLHSDYTSAGQIHIDIIAVLSGTSMNTASGVIRALLLNGLNYDENPAVKNIQKFGNEDVMWELINRYTGFERTEGATFDGLAAHILLTALSVTMSKSSLAGLEKLISEPHSSLCYALVNEWMHSDFDDELYDIARVVEDKLHLATRFDKIEVAELLNGECFPCINECIIRRFMTEISDNIIKVEDIVRATNTRRTMKWYKRVRHYYDGLLQVANMQKFNRDHIAGFHIAEHSKLFKAYCDEYYKMDTYYRQFHSAFGKSLKESSTVLEDLYKNVADYVENLYTNWYLNTLGSQWNKLTFDEFQKDSELVDIPQQNRFYNNQISPLLQNNGRVYVIISDALRYEVAAELCDLLVAETKGSAKLSAMQSMFPSATPYGMAALLPHKQITLDENLKVLCDGMSTDGTAAREKVLKTVGSGNVAITYKELLAMKQAERREKVADAQVVYIYHNTIDNAGENRPTEDQVFEACEDAISEIKNLIRVITNDLSGTNILITADHGFLYSYKPLEEKDKADKNFVSGEVHELDRRYIICDDECRAEHMIRIPMSNMNTTLVGYAPLENIRIKKSGGSMNYVHGGISLQECIVPVIEFKNMRSSNKKFVDVRKAELQLLSQSRKVSNSIFTLDFYQKEAAQGKVTAATYDIFMSDATGKAVSDTQTIIADKTDSDAMARTFHTRFTLKSAEFKKTESYFLNILEKGTTNIVAREEFSIDIAFINDFDF